MSDRELLELAAKAAGHRGFVYEWVDGPHWVIPGDNPITWDPLKDSGDALQLAADLRLLIKPGKHPGDGCTVESQRSGIAGCTSFQDDKRAQMRRAIVHVAAEIGRAMS